jgi:hypothetical protein
LSLLLLFHQDEHEDGCSDAGQTDYSANHTSGDRGSVG